MGVFKRGNVYWIDYYFHGKRKRERIGQSRKLAQDVFRKRKVEIAENKFLDVKRDEKIKFKILSELYLEEWSKSTKKSWKSDAARLKNINQFFGDKYISEITPSMIYEYQKMRKSCLTEKGRVLTKTSCNKEVALIRAIFNKAIEWSEEKGWGEITNPVRKIKLFRENNHRERYLSEAEIKKLLECLVHPECSYPNCKYYRCSRPLREIVIFVLNTGLRLGEVRNLKWRDVHYEEGFIVLRETKNGKDRKIPLNANAKRALLSVRKHPESECVFASNTGRPYSFRTAFNTAIKKAGLNDDPNQEKITFHSLRHTFASHLVMAGVDLYTVSQLLGHSTLEMTQRYAHLSPGHNARAVSVLDSKIDYKMDTYMDTKPKIEKDQNFVDVITTLESAT